MTDLSSFSGFVQARRQAEAAKPEEKVSLLEPKPPGAAAPMSTADPQSKIVHFLPEAGVNYEAENKQLREELASCHAALEQWMRTETEWARQRRIFKSMCENVANLIIVLDQHGNRIWCNPAFNHILGYTNEEVSGTYALAEVHVDDKTAAEEALQRTLRQNSSEQSEFRIQKKDGSWVHLQAISRPVMNPSGETDAILLICQDVSEVKTLAEAMEQTKTGATIATMAEGMARDFDQILTNVFGNLTIARNLNGPHNAIAVRLNEIERALKRARDLTEQMLSMSTSDQPRTRVSIEPVIQDAVTTVLRGTMVRAEYVFPRNMPELEVDVEAFSHAVRNVMTNSIQAMDKGVVRITAEILNQEQFANRIDVALKPGSYAGIFIQDQGHGMTERIAARAFEPYFTTRQGSQGLGLTTALSAIQRQGGTMLIDSTVGVGTTVSIYVPVPLGAAVAAPAPVAASPQAKSAPLPKLIDEGLGAPAVKTARRILLMDDEQMILDIVSRMLGHLGYEVKTCTDGAQAIAAFAKAKNQNDIFDIVLMDLLIPNGVGGQDAVHTIKKIYPAAKVIATSGHLDHPAMLDHRKHGFTAALEKPYKVEKLQQIIEFAMNAPA